jgi:hypothetical protein
MSGYCERYSSEFFRKTASRTAIVLPGTDGYTAKRAFRGTGR